MTRRKNIKLSSISERGLLQARMCDLPLRIEGTEIGARVRRLYEELDQKGITFKPHVWIGEEWFSPDFSPGFAIPFYLTHPRLTRLEEKMMLQAEGAGENECMKILRHEAGHAIDTAYRLHFKKRWRETFGSFAAPYPDTYTPKPSSRNYVQHLNYWYAQAHPAEDFAETFAVWLTPNSKWRTTYRGWGALRKLECVDELMSDIVGKAPVKRSKSRDGDLSTLKCTLQEHYTARQEKYSISWSRAYDRDLLRIFEMNDRPSRAPSAASIIRRLRVPVRSVVADGTGVAIYTINHLIDEIIDRCKQLELRIKKSLSATREELTIMLTVHTMRFIHSGQFQVAL